MKKALLLFLLIVVMASAAVLREELLSQERSDFRVGDIRTRDRIGFMVGTSKMLFDPKSDITTYELAACMDVLLTSLAEPRRHSSDVAARKLHSLPAEVRRHFVFQDS
jgi:hypothetical protein